MRYKWRQPFPIRKLDDEQVWDDPVLSEPGVYIIRRRTPVRRVGGTDPSGILYIGKSDKLRRRLVNFWNAEHTGSDFFWFHPSLASKPLGARVRSHKDLFKWLPRLTAHVAGAVQQANLARAERALLFAYIQKYGEPPPLNSSFPKRARHAPSSGDLRWARRAIEHGA